MNMLDLALLSIAALSSALSVRVPSSQARPPSPWPERYANTPAELLPFGHGLAPCYLFFKEPQPYRGPRVNAAPAAAAGPVRVGLLLPSPGSPDGARGAMLRRGVELAFAEADRSPGEPSLELVPREDAPLWGSSANGMAELCIQDRVVAVIGSVDGAASHVALRVALKTGVFLVNTATTDPTLTETAIPWLLRVLPDDRQHGYRLARLVVRERGLRRIAVLRANDRYGRTGIAEFLDSVRRLGCPVRVEMRYAPGDRTFATQVERIRAVDPEAVVLWGNGEDLGHAARALRAGGVQAPFFGPDRLVDPAFLEAAGGAAEGSTATFPFDPARSDPVWKDFQRRFREQHGILPDLFAAYAYDGARILIRSLRKVGPDRVRLRDDLAALRRYAGVTGPMRFDPTHNNLAPLHLVRVLHGEFIHD